MYVHNKDFFLYLANRFGFIEEKNTSPLCTYKKLKGKINNKSYILEVSNHYAILSIDSKDWFYYDFSNEEALNFMTKNLGYVKKT
jgi:hypothetical protein